jgi:hypothetical protein
VSNREEVLKQVISLEETVNQRSSRNVEQRCEKRAFDHDSIIGWSLMAAEHDDVNSVHIGKQSQGAERNNYSCHGTICGNSEIAQLGSSEENSSFPMMQRKVGSYRMVSITGGCLGFFSRVQLH